MKLALETEFQSIHVPSECKTGLMFCWAWSGSRLFAMVISRQSFSYYQVFVKQTSCQILIITKELVVGVYNVCLVGLGLRIIDQ